MHCFCTGCVVGGGQSVTAVPPSIDAGSAQATFEMACGASSQVQLEGQSLLDAHVTVSAEQCDVDNVIVMQTGGGGGATGPPSSEAAEPPPEHDPTSSGTHVKPSPQSAAVVHGSRYLGTHDVLVVVVQTGAGGGLGRTQGTLGGHAGEV
jgi:hypothetical protein